MLVKICLALFVLCMPSVAYQIGLRNKNCCPPEKYEGVMGFLGGLSISGKGESMSGFGAMSIDRTAMKVALQMNSTTSGVSTPIKVVQDFKNKIQYVANLEKMTCMKSKLAQPFYNGCVPDSLQGGYDFFYGLASDNLAVVSYYGQVKMAGAPLGVSLVVTKKDCVPTGEVIQGRINDVGMTISYGYLNITEGIRDISVFTPPAYCQQEEMLEEPKYKSYSVFNV